MNRYRPLLAALLIAAFSTTQATYLDGEMGNGTRTGDGLIGSGTRTGSASFLDDGGYLGSGNKSDDGGGVIGSGTSFLDDGEMGTDNRGGYFGSGN
ncbi:MAG TPA: hypothetical protein VGD69_06485 [Herpetosiphonaceae bacterium]